MAIFIKNSAYYSSHNIKSYTLDSCSSEQEIRDIENASGGKSLILVLGQYPGGEPMVKLYKSWYDDSAWNEVDIEIQGHSPLELLQLCELVDCLRSNNISIRNLNIPYFPGARQDRRNSPKPGDLNNASGLSVKVYADIINNLKIDNITILDPHSDVVTALVNNVNPISVKQVLTDNHAITSIKRQQLEEGGRLSSWNGYDLSGPIGTDFDFNTESPYLGVIAPDAGAAKKVFDLTTMYLFDPNDDKYHLKFAQAMKHRDTSTGQLSMFEAPKVEDGKWLVVDDICEEGGAFIGLAKAFKEKNPNSSLDLYVSHGIFSKPVSNLFEYYDNIITTNSWDQTQNLNDYPDRFKVIKVIDL